jgi:hypothetical protein
MEYFQHYEICDTPLLDITHSLRTACSFALQESNKHGYIYVLAMPYLTNRITYNSEEDLILVRLLSICPPAAKRPFYQDGYVVGTTDLTDDFDDKSELYVVNRLVAKFKIENSEKYWGSELSSLSSECIYPVDDTYRKIQEEVIELRNRGFYENTVGDFLQLWNEFERITKAKVKANTYAPISTAFKELADYNYDYKKYFSMFNEVRNFRNQLVHDTKKADEVLIEKYIKKLQGLIKTIQGNF